MEIKTTQQIIEDLGISLIHNNKDKIRDFTTRWIKVTEVEEMIILLGSTKKSLIDFYDALQRINKTGGRPNDNKEKTKVDN